MLSKNAKRLRRAAKFSHRRRSTQFSVRVHKSAQHIYAQLFDERANVVACASSLEPAIRGEDRSGCALAEAVGRTVAERALEKGVKVVCFDRAGYRYHGRIKALADGARAGGLEF